MARDRQPPKTDIGKQIRIGVKLGALVIAAAVLLFLCARKPVRRWTLHHPRFESVGVLTLPHPIGAITAGRLDGDAYSDLAVETVGTPTPEFVVFPGTPQGPDVQHPVPIAGAFPALDLVAGDLDNDGLDDLLITSRNDAATRVVVFWNQGGFRFESTAAPAALRLVDVFDEDGDGQADLVGLRRDFSDVEVHRAHGREIESGAAVKEGVNDTSVKDFAAADLDGGGMDVALVSGNRVRVLRRGGLIPDPVSYFNRPPLTIAGQRLSTSVPSLVFRDLNGDGRVDLAFLDAEAVTLLLWADGFVPARYPVPGRPATRLVTGDFNGDGVADLLTVGQDGQSLEILQGR